MKLIDSIKNPGDLKKLSNKELNALAQEIREFLVDNVSKTGGHLASSLGAVELTIALHKVFNSPNDKIVWDVGHQAYVHKILTGRAKGFSTLRQLDGISGFPRSYESEHDAFNAGHASNSVSAALGFACARDLKGEDNSVIAVIGDGAMSGGLAFEGINNASRLKTNFIVILNNNEMSISKNVGGMSHYLNRLRTNEKYNRIKRNISYITKHIPLIGIHLYNFVSVTKSIFRKMITKSPVFDELGFNCLGPVDGHDIEKLTEVLKRAKAVNGPVLIHIYTKKGKGYKFAEENPNVFHGIGKFDVKTGKAIKTGNALSPSYTFGKKLTELAKANKKICAITAAMPDGTGLKEFSRQFPNRFFDVGIAEGHAVTFAGGLAKGGFIPVVAIYSTFMQRAYDNLFHDIVLQNVHAVFALDRAGLVGEDGETHHGVFDISYISSLPNISILAPSSDNQLEQMLEYAINVHKGPIAIRYPKSLSSELTVDYKFEFGRAAVIKEGSDITLVSEGNMLDIALKASRLTEKSVEIIDIGTIKPVDVKTIKSSYNKTGRLITLEDNTTSGGFGSIVQSELNIPVTKIGYSEPIVPHGKIDELYKKTGVDAQSVAQIIERECSC